MWAAIPALLYYVAVFFAVHFVAKREGLAGVPRAELPRMGRVMVERGHLFIPIVIILTGLFMGYSAPLSALVAALCCLPVALLRASTRQGISWRSVLGALEEGARNTLAVAMACACAGIVIGCVTITGLGITFTQLVIALAQNSLVLALVLTAMAGIVLGMGMPTTPAYIVMVSLLVPAIIKLGAVTPAAHMFAFYFAILSAITPPVALAVFAAAGLAKANMWSTGWAAMRVGGAGLHRALHVRLRAGAADDRRLDHQPACRRVGHARRHPAGRRAVRLPVAAGHVVATRDADRRRAAADQAGLDDRSARPAARGGGGRDPARQQPPRRGARNHLKAVRNRR